jgi:hypothetical protein
MKTGKKKMDACLECQKWTSLETDSVAVHEEFPKEATVKCVRALEKEHEDQQLNCIILLEL